jgi:hypothetical protein
MNRTSFPTAPKDVVSLTPQEFVFDLDVNDDPPLDAICARFLNDANRALVWFIRFRALKAWCARADTAGWPQACSGTWRDASEVAAGFDLNDEWEFDEQEFCAAISVVASQRFGTR